MDNLFSIGYGGFRKPDKLIQFGAGFLQSPNIHRPDPDAVANMAATLNIQTTLIASLNLKFITTKEETDRDITISVGEKYKVSFIVDNTVVYAIGKIRSINNIPYTKVVNLINEDGIQTNDQFSITLDCSAECESEVFTIPVFSIRDIEVYPPVVVPDEEPADGVEEPSEDNNDEVQE